MTKKLLIVIGLIAIAALAMLSGKFGHFAGQVAEAATPKAPELSGTNADWVNTPNSKSLKLYGTTGVLADDPFAPGKHPIILVDFWEYTCVNCINTFPYVKQWQKLYQDDGLVVIGIHTPEFTFSHEAANVKTAVKHLGITYPVLIDSNFNNWNAFNNESWPADYILDSQGHIVDSHIGEGGYAETERTLRSLLLKANPGEALPPAYGDPKDSDSALATDLTPELYAGSNRAQIQNPEGFGSGQTITYAEKAAENWQDGYLELSGMWRFDGEYAQHIGTAAKDYVGVRYHGKDCVSVIKPDPGEPLIVYVNQDNAPVLKTDAGADIHYDSAGRSYLQVDQPREYSITRNAVSGEHALMLYPASERFKIYSFCFSGI